MIYERFEGNSVSISIENVDGSKPYTKIGNKAFLSCKNVYEIKMPDTICEIGDWAFAYAKELKRIIVPSKKITIGKNVFLDCDNLKEVVVYPDNSNNQGVPYLLASCITILKSYELLDFRMVVDQNELWCKLYDKELVRYILQADDKEFQPVIVGWFNDEGEEEQLERYLKKVRLDKIRLSLLRLKYDSYIEDDTKAILKSYLKKQTDGAIDCDNSSWTMLRYVLSEDIQYVKIAVSNALINEELMLDLIKYINDTNASTEIVAYLIQALDDNKMSIDKQFEL